MSLPHPDVLVISSRGYQSPVRVKSGSVDGTYVVLWGRGRVGVQVTIAEDLDR